MRKLRFWSALVMGSIMSLDLAGHSFIAYCEHIRKTKEKMEQCRAVQPLIHYAGAIIGGYVFPQDKDEYLTIYDQSFSIKSHYATQKDKNNQGNEDDKWKGLTADIHVKKLEHDGQRGWIWVELGSGGPPGENLDLWFITKEGLQWKVEFIDSGLDGRRWLWRDNEDDEWD